MTPIPPHILTFRTPQSLGMSPGLPLITPGCLQHPSCSSGTGQAGDGEGGNGRQAPCGNGTAQLFLGIAAGGGNFLPEKPGICATRKTPPQGASSLVKPHLQSPRGRLRMFSIGMKATEINPEKGEKSRFMASIWSLMDSFPCFSQPLTSGPVVKRLLLLCCPPSLPRWPLPASHAGRPSGKSLPEAAARCSPCPGSARGSSNSGKGPGMRRGRRMSSARVYFPAPLGWGKSPSHSHTDVAPSVGSVSGWLWGHREFWLLKGVLATFPSVLSLFSSPGAGTTSNSAPCPWWGVADEFSHQKSLVPD